MGGAYVLYRRLEKIFFIFRKKSDRAWKARHEIAASHG
jgi:hypothetical protein